MTRVIPEQSASPLAGDIMTDSVVASSRTTTMRDLATQMFLGGFSGVPITERDGRIVGLVTEFDIIRGIQAGRPIATTIAEVIMTRNVITVNSGHDTGRSGRYPGARAVRPRAGHGAGETRRDYLPFGRVALFRRAELHEVPVVMIGPAAELKARLKSKGVRRDRTTHHHRDRPSHCGAGVGWP